MYIDAGIRSGVVATLLALAAATGSAWGHEQHTHDAEQLTAAGTSEAVEQEAENLAMEPFPADIGGHFALIDQAGRAVTDADFRGRFMLIFFGYVQCDSICPVGLKRMAEAIDLLGAPGERVQPILITVDPEDDTPEVLAAFVPSVHPRLIGLTGDADAVAAAMESYKVSAKPIGQSWKGTPVISHGSYIYLMGPDGELLTVLPPVFSAEAMAGIIGRYLNAS